MEEEEEEEVRSVFMVNFPLSVIPFDLTDTRIAGSQYLISGGVTYIGKFWAV